MKPLVYISSPYSGNIEENVKRAQKCCRWAALHAGVLPIAPHLLFPQFLSEETEREKAFELNEDLIERCDVVWVFAPNLIFDFERLETYYFRFWEGDTSDNVYEACTRGMKHEMCYAHYAGKQVIMYLGSGGQYK